MEQVNAIGRPCPLPVIEAKKAIGKLPQTGGQVCVLVDDPIAKTNLEKLATGKGYGYESNTLEDGTFEVIFTVTGKEAVVAEDGGLVVAIGKNTMGEGSDELGAMLMKSFIFSLTELDTPPEHILFYNGGVLLTTEGSNVLEDLQVLVEKGTMIDSCGACLNYYQLAEKLQIGGVTNMYAIVSTMASGKKLINL